MLWASRFLGHRAALGRNNPPLPHGVTKSKCLPERFRSSGPAYATGFGDLTVHEVATDPTDASRAYLSYYSGGLRALQIVGTELVETGGYLDPKGNNFWGVEAFARNGESIIIASDRDSGLWIFRRTAP